MRRANRPDLQTGEFPQSHLHRISILPDDIRVITNHLFPIMLHVHLRVYYAAIQSAVRTERVRREENLIRSVVGHHHLRPMHHRRHIESQLVASRVKGIALLHLMQPLGDAMKTRQHAERLAIPDNLHARILLTQQTDATRMIRLHVIDNQVIQRTAVQRVRYFLQEDVRVTYIHRINQDGLLVDNQVRVVRNPIRQRPHILEQCLLAIVHAHVINLIRYLF